MREAYHDATILIGGIEASLRRLAHYDYWDDKVRKSILIDANADLLMYGMGENSIIEIAEALDAGLDVHDLTYLDGTVFKTKDLSMIPDDHIMLPSFFDMTHDKKNMPNHLVFNIVILIIIMPKHWLNHMRDFMSYKIALIAH